MGVLTNRSLYLQVRDALAERIARREWKANTSIPNEYDLAREFGVSAGTLRKALDLLESERLVTRRQGRGTFVNDPASQEAAIRFSHLHTPDGQRVGGLIGVRKITLEAASEAECKQLHLEQEDQVYRIDRVRSHNDATFMVELVSMPAALFPGLPEKGVPSWCAVVIAQAYDLLLGKAVEQISVGSASPSAAGILNIAEGSPILALDRVIKTLDGRPAEWRRAQCVLGELYYLADTK